MHSSRTSLLLVPLLILALFAPTLVGTHRLAFRDVSHFYTPLYDYIAARSTNQWLPLWNPLDQTGIPLLGETTTAVLYPIRYLVFALPISSETALAWYVVIHLIIASVTARIAARWAGVGSLSATLAGIAYPLSGSVLFLYCNPPFLVGAAWLPLVVGVMLSRRKLQARLRILVGGPAMSMMILGGDPQTAVHAMIVVTTFCLFQLVRRSRRTLSLKTVVAVPLVAALSSAPQLAASISWSRQSDRVETSPAESFAYSLPPWHAVELVTPNAFGRYFPVYHRVSQLITGDGRMWTPTIYMGMIVVIGCGLWIGRLRQHGIDRWLAMAVACLWLAMGHFGMVILFQWVTGRASHIDSAIGSPYWVLYQFLPGYDAFRYPAKWLPLFALGLAIGMAKAIDQYQWKQLPRNTMTVVSTFLVVALVGVTTLRVNTHWITDRYDQIPSDVFWGPIDVAGGLEQIQWSIGLSLMTLAAIATLIQSPLSTPWKNMGLLVLLILDLGIANAGLIATIPRDRELQLVEHQSPQALVPGSRWMRTVSSNGWPDVWQQESDLARMLDVEASLRISRYGRWHLVDRINVLNNMVSINSRQMRNFWDAARVATADMTTEEQLGFWYGIRDWLAIDGVIHLSDSAIQIDGDDRPAAMIDHQLKWNPQTTTLRFLPGVTEQSVAQESIALDHDYPSRLRRLAEQPPKELLSQADIGDDETTFANVKINELGIITRPVFQDGHWTAEIRESNTDFWRSTPVFPVDGICQGIQIPAGNWDVRFRYQPFWLIPTFVIAIGGWFGILVWVIAPRAVYGAN